MHLNNNTILQKCVDELKTEKPDLSYIRGMIETLIAVAEKPPVFVPKTPEGVIPKSIPVTKTVEPSTSPFDNIPPPPFMQEILKTVND